MMSDSPVTEESVVILTPRRRRRGRPPSDQPCTALTAWVPVDLHDKLIALAAKKGESVSATVKALLLLRLDNKGGHST